MNTRTRYGLVALPLLVGLTCVSHAAVTLLNDNRIMTLSGTFGGVILGDVETPAAPFADFLGNIAGGGLSATQNSSFAPNQFEASGSFVAIHSTVPGFVVHSRAESIYEVVFSVDTPTEYNLWGNRDLGF